MWRAGVGIGLTVQPDCTRLGSGRKEEFKREVEHPLAGQETERWEIIYFKVCKSQISVIAQPLETAASSE